MPRRDDDELDDYDPEEPDESDMDSTDEPDFSEEFQHKQKATWVVVTATVLLIAVIWSIRSLLS